MVVFMVIRDVNILRLIKTLSTTWNVINTVLSSTEGFVLSNNCLYVTFPSVTAERELNRNALFLDSCNPAKIMILQKMLSAWCLKANF